MHAGVLAVGGDFAAMAAGVLLKGVQNMGLILEVPFLLPYPWMTSGLLWAEAGFSKVRGHEDLPRLAQALSTIGATRPPPAS